MVNLLANQFMIKGIHCKRLFCSIFTLFHVSATEQLNSIHFPFSSIIYCIFRHAAYKQTVYACTSIIHNFYGLIVSKLVWLQSWHCTYIYLCCFIKKIKTLVNTCYIIISIIVILFTTSYPYILSQVSN